MSKKPTWKDSPENICTCKWEKLDGGGKTAETDPNCPVHSLVKGNGLKEEKPKRRMNLDE